MTIDRFIAEKVMEKHYHTPYVYVSGQESIYRCADPKCGNHKIQCLEPLHKFNPNYSTGKDKADLMDKCVGEEWWEDFEGDAIEKWQNKSPRMFSGHHKLSFTAYLWRNLRELVAEYKGWEGEK